MASNEEPRPCPNCDGKLHVTGKDDFIWLKCDKCETEFYRKNKDFETNRREGR